MGGESSDLGRNSRVRGWPGDCFCVRRLPAGDRVTRDEEARRRSIERDVLTYVLERPAAKDTAEGVRHWWLRNDAGFTARDVRMALTSLAAKGWFVAREMQSEAGEDALVYELNASCTDEIRRHLAASRAQGEPDLSLSPEMPEGTRRG